MSIFVSIAAYRDPELVKTIASALAEAENPEQLTFGICWQRGKEDGDYAAMHQVMEDPRFTVKEFDYEESQGPCWARSIANSLIKAEDYFLQIDSHMRFAEGWDLILVDMLDRCPSDKAVISTYPSTYNSTTEWRSNEFWHMIPSNKDDSGVMRFCPVVRKERRLRASMYLAAGFIFSRRQFAIDVPYDPDLYFHGEEISLSVRAWTRGYDFFLPDKRVVWHEYSGGKRIRHWVDHSCRKETEFPFAVLDARCKAKVRRLISQREVGIMGLGTVRTLDEYENHSGVLFAKNFISPKAREGADVPIYTDSSWKEIPVFRFKGTLDWSERREDIEAFEPDFLAVFFSGKRHDMSCADGVPVERKVQRVGYSVQDRFLIWPYRVKPLLWGRKYTVKLQGDMVGHEF